MADSEEQKRKLRHKRASMHTPEKFLPKLPARWSQQEKSFVGDRKKKFRSLQFKQIDKEEEVEDDDEASSKSVSPNGTSYAHHSRGSRQQNWRRFY